MFIIIPCEKEIFKVITYPTVKKNSYKISNYGRVFSLITNTTLSAYKDSKGYCRVQLCCENKKSTNFKIHRLVAWEFCEGYNQSSGKNLSKS